MDLGIAFFLLVLLASLSFIIAGDEFIGVVFRKIIESKPFAIIHYSFIIVAVIGLSVGMLKGGSSKDLLIGISFFFRFDIIGCLCV